MAKFRTIERWAVGSRYNNPTRPPALFMSRAEARRHNRTWSPDAPAPVKVRIEAVNPRERAPKAARKGRTR